MSIKPERRRRSLHLSFQPKITSLAHDVARPARSEEATEDASPDEPDEPGTVDPSVLSTLYEEIRDELDRQLGQIDGLNERAQQLFGFSAVILTIIAAVAPNDATHAARIALVAAIPMFGLAALFAARAWRFANWRGDPNVTALWKRQRKQPEERFRYQVVMNRLDSISVNEDRIEKKVAKLKRAHLCLYVGFVYLAVLVALRLLL